MALRRIAVPMLIALAVAALTAGCKEKRTMVILVADTDLVPGREFDAIEFDVKNPDGEMQSARTIAQNANLPATLGLRHERHAYGPFEATVRAVLRRSTVVERRASFFFVRRRTAMLRMDLSRSCAGFTCGSGMTCANGRCRAVEIDPDELESWEGDPGRLDGSIPEADAGDACAPIQELCNTSDDDCDGRVDEGFDLNEDEANCGDCNVMCSAPNAVTTCSAGECAITGCQAGWDDCDKNESNGCEVDLNTLANCGACGRDCELPNATSTCMDTMCVIESCEEGWGDCDGLADNGCEQSLNTRSHCGECKRECDLPHADDACVDGTCRIDTCEQGWSNCNEVDADGCEAWLSSPATCRRCTRMCGAGDVCAGESPTVAACPNSCPFPYRSCARSCVDTDTEPRHCGDCGNLCPTVPHARSTCDEGECGFSCDQGFADCDDDPDNGCEANLEEPAHCGDCDTRCNDSNPECVPDGDGYQCRGT